VYQNTTSGTWLPCMQMIKRSLLEDPPQRYQPHIGIFITRHGTRIVRCRNKCQNSTMLRIRNTELVNEAKDIFRARRCSNFCQESIRFTQSARSIKKSASIFPSLARFSKASIVFRDLETYPPSQLTDFPSFYIFSSSLHPQ